MDPSRVIKTILGDYFLYWLKGGNRFYFKDDKVIKIPSNSEKTYWVINNDSLIKIDNNEIKEIEVQKTNGITTSVLVVILGVFLILITFDS